MPNAKASLTEAKSVSLTQLWQFGYIVNELSFALSVTSTLHRLVAMEANPPAARFWQERAESYVALWHGPDRHHGICGLRCGETSNAQQRRGNGFRRAAPEFSDEQRGRIFDGIMRISNAPVTEMAAPEVADPLPEEVPMQELPTDIIHEIPLVRGHKFVKFDDRILVVSSTSRLVVAMIPRYKLLP